MYAFLGRLEVERLDAIVTGTISVSHQLVYALFDPGSTFSYVSTYYATQLDLSYEPMYVPILVATSTGDSLVVDQCQHSPLELVPVVKGFADVFPTDLLGLQRDRKIDFGIDIEPGTQPVSFQPYRMAPIELRDIKEKFKDLFGKGFIRPSVSYLGAHVLSVKKKDGTLCMCINYRKLDKGSGDIPKTTFRTRYDHYEFLVMSFELTNYSTTFIELMNRVFRPYLDSFVKVVIDDILVYFGSRKQHEQHLRIVLHTSREKWLYEKFTKCEFFLESVAFLGHIVSKNDIMVDMVKIEAVHGWAKPTSTNAFCSFVGLSSYYRRFVEGVFFYYNTLE
ncbi:hypothetical protein MTR67_018368 [Solanum verrucosum]|uniref:Reverse transcriptase domain-containing protein n=1 Tax=Solanum verrucosum TaxID=315347 RepID=A0AAF0TTN3_SOLVR|nr:hypothetical protein MTR67_018368 [Solanum verrucosum]